MMFNSVRLRTRSVSKPNTFIFKQNHNILIFSVLDLWHHLHYMNGINNR